MVQALEPSLRLMVPPENFQRTDPLLLGLHRVATELIAQDAAEPLSALAAPRGWPVHSHHLNSVNDTSSGAGVASAPLVNDTNSSAGVASASDGLVLASHNITFIVIGTVALLLLIAFTCCCCYRDRLMPPRLPPAAFAEAKEASMGEHVGAYVISDKDATYTSDHHRTGIRDYTFTCSSIGLVLTDTALGAVRIDRVLPDSPANEQGIAPRSTIIAINAQSIRLSAAEVATLISTLPRPITLRLQDDELIWEDEASSQRFARIPVVPRTGDNDFNYAVPVALSLFMRVALEGALVFTALFMLSLPTIRDNLMRSEARAACRDAGSTVAGYQALTNPGNASKAELKHLEAKLKFPPAECGWEGLPIRRFQHASIWKVVQGSILGSSLGGCNEYRDCDTRVLARCDQVSGSDCVSLRVSLHMLASDRSSVLHARCIRRCCRWACSPSTPLSSMLSSIPLYPLGSPGCSSRSPRLAGARVASPRVAGPLPGRTSRCSRCCCASCLSSSSSCASDG